MNGKALQRQSLQILVQISQQETVKWKTHSWNFLSAVSNMHFQFLGDKLYINVGYFLPRATTPVAKLEVVTEHNP